MSDASFEQVQEAAAYIAAQVRETPKVALVLGSGLGAVADEITDAVSLPYVEIPHFPRSTVSGHRGVLRLGRIRNAPCVVMQGRHHYYEGYTLSQSTFGVRVMRALGAQALLVTNAAGGMHASLSPGDFMVICDHLNYMGNNPLRGPNEERFGPRFFDMTQAYAVNLRALLHDCAAQQNLSLREGVYAAVHGPSYETPAEIRALQRLGADAVGMSTVSEVICARHMGMPVAGLSVITNFAAGLSPVPLSHSDVTDVGRRVAGPLCKLLVAAVGRMGEGT